LSALLCGCNPDIVAGVVADDSDAHKAGNDSAAPQVVNVIARSGAASKVFWFASVTPDCTETPGFSARFVDQPAHGTVKFGRDEIHPRYDADNPRNTCNSRLVPHWVVIYTSAGHFVGHDKFSFDEVFADGPPTRVEADVDVK
jgi:hypothetical protein